MKKRIFVFLTSLCMLCCMMLMPMQVSAYTDLNGYPFVVDNMMAEFYQHDASGNYIGNIGFNGTLSEQNSYLFSVNQSISGIHDIRFGNMNSSLVLPLNTELYDYYVVGTVAFAGLGQDDLSDISSIQFYNHDNVDKGDYFNFTDNLVTVPFVNWDNVSGHSFYARIFEINISNFSYMIMNFDSRFEISNNVWFSASIVPVAKGTEAEQLNQAILAELVKINQNLVSLQSLQQQTIDAIKEHDTNEKSWFQQLIQSMGIGFSTLYEQMTKEQDEQLHGYEDTTVSEANEAFTSESDKLTGVENELSGASNQYVTEYTAEGFDLGLFTTLANTFAYIATWFTNFWNMGGIFTKALNLCLALSIGFTILRLH